MVDQEFKGVAPPTLSELCGGLWMQNDPAQTILKDEPKMKIIFFFQEGFLCGQQRSLRMNLYIFPFPRTYWHPSKFFTGN